eukprot:CAMPEP_0178715296 /NCGR_PEP_ID=MMETSP0699-20121125/20571_1 /TAXON_ID=265572 /ORGANISM="Extubocellulus spinifer, Strain CCMP396" /LENGTH=46 /DNA_ID= /DNA_START= /DNA_END= /DNA_ORIENTATION=
MTVGTFSYDTLALAKAGPANSRSANLLPEAMAMGVSSMLPHTSPTA